MEWTVVTALVVVVGLFITVGTPIIKLNNTLTKILARQDNQEERSDKQEKELEEQKQHAHDAHKKLWDHNTEQDKKINDHENRIQRLEEK